MIELKKNISRIAVKNANDRLISNGKKLSKNGRIIENNSNNGTISFTAKYVGKKFQVEISKTQIKNAFRKSISDSISK